MENPELLLDPEELGELLLEPSALLRELMLLIVAAV
jgi:hypothetical protein